MAMMKCSGATNMAVSGNGNHMDEVDLFSPHCWPNPGGNIQSDYIDINQKLLLGGTISSLGPDKILLGSPMSQEGSELEREVAMETLDNLINTQQITELKPLPPFTGYTANLSINGIPGHHYHTISNLPQRLMEENNNKGFSGFNEQNVVSSSTCNIDSVTDSSGKYSVNDVVKLNYSGSVTMDSVESANIYNDPGTPIADSVTQIKTEITEYDINIDNYQFCSFLGSAIADADTTLQNNSVTTLESNGDEPSNSRDSWSDLSQLQQWLETDCMGQQKTSIVSQVEMTEYGLPSTSSDFTDVQAAQEYTSKVQPQSTESTLQTLLTHTTYMPLLQNRLQNGPPIKQEAPSSTNYGAEMISTSSPPSNVVSTTDNILLSVNGRFLSQYNVHMEDHRIRSPELLGQNYPHTTTTTPNPTKKQRSRAQRKQTTSPYQSDQSLGLVGREKPIHKCNICNRGFLNKSNIKVHLRTHTGEKPFKCDTCAKAFRQKAHLLKHQQIHKRIGRD